VGRLGLALVSGPHVVDRLASGPQVMGRLLRSRVCRLVDGGGVRGKCVKREGEFPTLRFTVVQSR